MNDEGIYAVQFYSLGVPHTIIVDDYMPTRTWGRGDNTLLGHRGDDGSFWGALIEKAFAKYWGNYKHTSGGLPHYALRTMTGAPWVNMNSSEGVDKLWDLIVSHDGQDSIINTGTNGSDHFTQNEIGLANGHAYTVIGAK